LTNLQGMIQKGIDSGPGRFSSIEEVIAEAKNRHKGLLKNSA
jgi:hypothetical protein